MCWSTSDDVDVARMKCGSARYYAGMGTTAYERVLSVAVAALHERDPERLWPLLAAELPVLCGGDALIYKLDDWSESEGTLGVSPAADPEFTSLRDEEAGPTRTGDPVGRHLAGPGRQAP